jgi:hypothetical protein
VGAVAGGAFLLGVVIHLNTLDNGFVYDDKFVILENEVVTEPERLGDVFVTSYWGSLAHESSTTGYRPLTILSYHLNHRLSSGEPFSYHAVNVLLHALVCALVALLAWALTRSLIAAALVSAVFALHAVHTEAVASIVGRAELLAGLFSVGALLVHRLVGELARRSRGAALGTAALAFLLTFAGLLSKETALAVPLLAACMDWYERRSPAAVWPAYAAHALAVVAFLSIRLHLFGEVSPAGGVEFVDNPMVALTPIERAPAALLIFGKAVMLTVLPVRLSSDYAYDQLPVDAPLASGLFWLGAGAAACLLLVAWSTRRSHRFVPAAVGMFVLAYAPVSNLVLTTHTVFGERTLYLPSLGACLLMGWLGARLVVHPAERVRVVAAVVLVLYGVLLGARTYTRNDQWQSDWTLTSVDIRTSPRSVRLLNNHGNELMSRGRVAPACKHLREAVHIHDGVPTIRANLGLCELKLGNVREAIGIFEGVLAEDPDNSVAVRHLPIAEEILAAQAPGTDRYDQP